LHRLTGPAAPDCADAVLLDRHLSHGDGTAFAALVRRHGPLVLSVCRRVLHNEADAEDAFQATFVVLTRRAAAIRKQPSLASWLHGVALRCARKLRADLNRRSARQRELVGEPTVTPADDLSWREVRRVLDEELARLPAACAGPLVLCYLTGKTQDEAARELRLPLATLRGRLERGRLRLRQRLTRRGVTLGAALLALATCTTAVSARLVESTAAGAVSPRAAALARGVLNAMLLSKARIAAGIVAAAVGLCAAAAHWAPSQAGEPPVTVSRAANRPPAPAQAKEQPPVHEVKPPPRADDVWTLDFRFKDPRQITVDLPGAGKTSVWYLPFEILNNTGKPRTVVLEFDWLIDGKPVATDQVIPAAFAAIAKIEDPTGDLGFKDTIALAAEPLAAAKTKEPARGAWGLALWKQGPLDVPRFTIFVGGLSNSWVTVDDGAKPVLRRKTLQLNFKRVGERYEFVPPAEWIYRLAVPREAGKEKPDPVPPPPDGKPAPPKLDGSILKVEDKERLVLLSVGADAGLEKGMQLEVYRLQPAAVYLGRVEVIAVEAGRAVARPVGRQGKPLQAGDKVAGRLLADG
jgi:RNA polymerase sigma factor (sigma-70 family)